MTEINDGKGEIRILIVDDQPGMVETLEDILKDRGYDVALAEDGFEAIDKAKESKFDLIFMDIKMPGINGVQTFREIKKINPNAAVVMMTAYAVEDLVREAIEEGAYTVIHKPFDVEKVLQTIERVLEGMLVLIVDDRYEDREVFKDVLESRGYKVAVAKNGMEAINVVKEGSFDIVFMDIKMPDFDGVQTFEEIHKIKPKVPVIMVTGYTMDELVEKAIEKGAYSCIFKPFDIEHILKIMEDVWVKKKRQLSSS